MKIRIKGNSLRVRLTKTEVNTLTGSGYLEDQILFANNKLVYAVQRVDTGDELSATMDNNKITMFVPLALIKDWPENNVVGFDTNMPLAENTCPDDPVARGSLYLLLEKDFVCLDHTTEDQSDHYENPNKTC